MKIVLSLILILGLFFNQQRIQKQQDDSQMIVLNEDLSPSIAVTSIALGPLKGMVSAGLMWRAIDKEDKKEYMESYQLSKMITALQPRYSSAWVQQAFTLSFNIAAYHKRPEERWQWIMRGIEILRDEGLTYNPNDADIRHEIMRTIKDKIQGTDKNALFMKNEWTKLMLEYFDDGSPEELERLRKAAKTLEELKTRPYINELAEVALSNGIDLYDFKSNPPQLDPNYVGYLFGGRFPNDKQFPLVKTAIINLYFFHRRQKIERDLKFSIERMIEINQELGPFDWRSHIATALYWGYEENFENYDTKAKLDYTPMTVALMLDNFYEGKLYYNKENDVFTRSPNIAALARIHRYYDALLEFEQSRRNHKSHEYFLQRAITICYNMNQSEAARELFFHYKENNYNGSEEKDISFNEFILGAMVSTLKSNTFKENKALIESVLISSIRNAEAGNFEMSQGLRNRAMLMYRVHQKEWGKTSQKLPKFQFLEKSAKLSLAGNDESRLERMEKSLSEAIKSERKKIATH